MIDAPFREFVEALAARTPAPGGGAASSHAGVMGAALLGMALRFARGRKDLADREADLDRSLALLDTCVERMLPMAERDMASFERVAAAYKLPHDTDHAKIVRTRAIQEALAGAMVVPEELLHLSRDALVAVDGVADCISRNIIADFGAGAELVMSAARSAELIVRVNARYLHDREIAQATVERARALVEEIAVLRQRFNAAVEEQLHR